MGKIFGGLIVIVLVAIGVFFVKKDEQKVMAPAESVSTGKTQSGPENFKYPTENPPNGNPDISDRLPKQDASSDQSVREISLSAHNWYFDPKEIRVKQGERVQITMKSVSGTHALSIPELSVKSDVAKEGESVMVEFVTDKKGEFSFKCSFYCGEGHSDMLGKLVVE